MEDAAVVRVLHGPGDRLDVRRGPPGLERPALADHLPQAPALDQPHREVHHALGVADVVDRHDVVVLELRQRLGLVAESRLGPAVARDGRIAPPFRLDQLERDQPAGVALERPVDDPHAAGAKPLQNDVIAEGPADGPIHLRRVAGLTRPAVDRCRLGIGAGEGISGRPRGRGFRSGQGIVRLRGRTAH